MKILFAHHCPDLYGASRSLLRLSSQLVRDGHTCLAILPEQGTLGPALTAAGVQVRIVPEFVMATRERLSGLRGKWRTLIAVPAAVSATRKVIREFSPDVVHTNTAVTFFSAIAARLEGRAHVWHVRESFNEYPSLWRFYQWCMWLFTDRIICVSTPMADQFSQKLRDKVIVIHNGFPREEFECVGADRVREFRRVHQLGDRRLVGVVGRIKMGRKGQDVFLRAAAVIKDRFPDVHFVVVGGPFPGNEPHADMLRSLADELGLQGRVTFTGDVKDSKAAIAALEISILPSAQPEPFGGVVIESMALSRPVIGTNIGGTTEQVADGETGVLVPPNDPETLAAALTGLLSDPKLTERMGIRAKERFLEKFEFKPFYRRILQEYAAVQA